MTNRAIQWGNHNEEGTDLEREGGQPHKNSCFKNLFELLV